ncbi:hypothetical protein OH492_09245 [Vibrio chagasii]|nr:hypothetical protein [Vibrio chagasii]
MSSGIKVAPDVEGNPDIDVTVVGSSMTRLILLILMVSRDKISGLRRYLHSKAISARPLLTEGQWG